MKQPFYKNVTQCNCWCTIFLFLWKGCTHFEPCDFNAPLQSTCNGVPLHSLVSSSKGVTTIDFLNSHDTIMCINTAIFLKSDFRRNRSVLFIAVSITMSKSYVCLFCCNSDPPTPAQMTPPHFTVALHPHTPYVNTATVKPSQTHCIVQY